MLSIGPFTSCKWTAFEILKKTYLKSNKLLKQTKHPDYIGKNIIILPNNF